MQYLNREGQYWRLLRYFQWGILLPLGVVLALLINFDVLFVLFHQVFFNNDAWLFNPATDPIILALPAEFFMHSFLLAFGLIEVLLVIGYFTTKYRISAPSRWLKRLWFIRKAGLSIESMGALFLSKIYRSMIFLIQHTGWSDPDSGRGSNQPVLFSFLLRFI